MPLGVSGGPNYSAPPFPDVGQDETKCTTRRRPPPESHVGSCTYKTLSSHRTSMAQYTVRPIFENEPEPAACGPLYKIKYHRGTSQIHHQAAPSRAQAAGAVVIGRSRGAFQCRVARHSPRHGQQGEYGGRACRAGNLREWRPLRIAWGLRARLKAQNALSCTSGLYLPGPAQGG